MPRLAPVLWEQLQNVLKRAFDRNGLLQLATLHLPFGAQSLVDFGKGVDEIAFHLIRVADERGHIEQLIRAVEAERPNVPEVTALVTAFGLQAVRQPDGLAASQKTRAVDSGSASLAHPPFAHPLHAYPRGPIVPAEKITFELIDAFAQCVSTNLAVALLNKANAYRLEANADAGLVLPHWIGPPDPDPILFWTKVMNRAAAGQGPRMVAALLTLPTDDLIDYRQFPERAQNDRTVLLEYLRNLPQVPDMKE